MITSYNQRRRSRDNTNNSLPSITLVTSNEVEKADHLLLQPRDPVMEGSSMKRDSLKSEDSLDLSLILESIDEENEEPKRRISGTDLFDVDKIHKNKMKIRVYRLKKSCKYDDVQRLYNSDSALIWGSNNNGNSNNQTAKQGSNTVADGDNNSSTSGEGSLLFKARHPKSKALTVENITNAEKSHEEQQVKKMHMSEMGLGLMLVGSRQYRRATDLATEKLNLRGPGGGKVGLSVSQH